MGGVAVILAVILAALPRCTLAQSAIPRQEPIQFAAAAIKPPDPNVKFRPGGFNGYPGGRIFFGGNVAMLVEYAFGLQSYQVTGGPDWVRSQQFDITAVPPDDSASRGLKIRNAEPTEEQRQMLRSLLRDRFGLQYHMQTNTAEVYLLTRGKKDLQFKSPKDSTADPRAIIYLGPGEMMSGEAEGDNTTTDYLAARLSRYLQLPVLNRTGIAGSWDFHIPPFDPENHDIPTAVYGAIDRLGLHLERSHGPVETLVIDHIDQPSPN
jgi:uncharacterized protein (TIGR03435 family)